jgi:hypothetical protein
VVPEALARTPLAGDVAAALEALPRGPGVGQLLAEGGRSLLIGTASNLRRWAASHLGLARARPAPGGRARRPRTSLAGLATEVAWVEADGPFRQRLLYERLSARHVPPAARRDLRPPFFLHLDPAERFPRASVRPLGEGPLYGPFRDRRAAEKARAALQRAFPLRPCEYVFEPDPALPLGLGCLYAQVRSCSAPCLSRVSESGYREVAAAAAAWLAEPARRLDADAGVPPSVAAACGRAVIVDVAGRRGVGLYPLRDGCVLDASARVVEAAELDVAVAGLEWPAPSAASDWAWLTAWLASPRRRASLVIVPEPADAADLVRLVRAALPPAFAALAPGGNVGRTRGEA